MASDRSNRRWFILFAFLPLAGCATLQDAHYEHVQKLRTEKAWNRYKRLSDCWNINSDYRKGWKAGYYDVTTGGDGCPPMVAPHRYWSPFQITHHCDQRRQEWYVGYQDGAMMASLEPDTHYLKLWNPPAVQAAGYVAAPHVGGAGEPQQAPGTSGPDLPSANPEGEQAPPGELNTSTPPADSNLPPIPETPEKLQ